MSRGKSRSPLRVGARKQRAFEMFGKGYSNVEVADDLQVTPGTASRYRKEYEAQLQSQVKANPELLKDVLGNTVRALEELDKVRAAAWEVHDNTNSENVRLSALGRITAAQDQRAKLFGLFGVKAEYFLHVEQVRAQQHKIIEFLTKELCPADRIKLEEYLINEFRGELAEMPETASVDGP